MNCRDGTRVHPIVFSLKIGNDSNGIRPILESRMKTVLPPCIPMLSAQVPSPIPRAAICQTPLAFRKPVPRIFLHLALVGCSNTCCELTLPDREDQLGTSWWACKMSLLGGEDQSGSS